MNDALDREFWGGSGEIKPPVVAEAATEQGSNIEFYHNDLNRWISPEEWHWRMNDKELDGIRKKKGLSPMGDKYREKALAGYLQSL